MPDVERILSEERIAVASRRLEAQRLPFEEQAQRLTALDEELKLFNKRAIDVKQFLEDYKRGKVSDEFLNSIKYRADNPHINQAQSLQASVPKLAQKLLDMEWNVHKYSKKAFRFTSDNPLMIFPLAVPASKNDWEAHELFSMIWLGIVHFYTDEIIEDYPPMAFILPLTPHFDLSIAPHGQMLASDNLLDQKDASTWNLF